MCDNCFLQEYASFPTYQDFERFDSLLTQKLQLVEGLYFVGDEQIGKLHSCATYKCRNCGTTWQLSEPDNAWRGFFLAGSSASKYLSKIETVDKYRRLGCLAVIVASLILIIWALK